MAKKRGCPCVKSSKTGKCHMRVVAKCHKKGTKGPGPVCKGRKKAVHRAKPAVVDMAYV